MPYVEWTPDMGEISGFGGSYEEACRLMVRSGVEYWEAQDAALARGERTEKFDPHYKGMEGVYGLIIDDNPDAKALDEAVMSATMEVNGKTVRVGEQATGAMHHACIQHVFAFRRIGADAYVEMLRTRDNEEASQAEG